MFAPYFLLQLAYLAGKEFNRTPAFGAYHVVMTASIVLVFVACDAVVEGDLAGQSALRKQFQGAVDGRVANVDIFLLYQAMQFVSRKVITSLQKGSENRIPLCHLLQPDPLQMAMQNVLSFADHLVRNQRMIVNALL
jgi:hypothetical protein